MTDSRPDPTPTAGKHLGLGCAVVFALLLLGLLGAAFFWGPNLAQRLAGKTGNTPLPFEDETSPEHVAEVRTRAAERLNSYGWVDQEAGIAHIPISQAMRLIAAAGLPVGEPAPAAAAPTGTPAASSADEPPVDLSHVTYEADVLPIFQEYCEECHGAEDPEENLELMRYRTAMAGSQNGPVIEPGDPDNSYLVKQIVEGKMPKDRDPLPQRDIDIIIAWIKAGAPEK